MVTDASQFAWGAHISKSTSSIFQLDIAQGQCQAQGPHMQLCRGTFDTAHAELGSTVREFEAVVAALRTTNVRLQGSCVRLFSDNTGVV